MERCQDANQRDGGSRLGRHLFHQFRDAARGHLASHARLDLPAGCGGVRAVEQAAKLAGMVPNPRYYDRNRNAPGLARKTAIILSRMPSAELP